VTVSDSEVLCSMLSAQRLTAACGARARDTAAAAAKAMRINFVLTLAGTDRIGLLEDVTRRVLELDGNVEARRMAHLSGEFAMLLLVSMPAERQLQLDALANALIGAGYKVTISRSDTGCARSYGGWLPGIPLFSTNALVGMPPAAGSGRKSALENTGDKLNMGIRITRAAS
jgi:predicted amino acid-binding ACT domain protein